MSSIFLLNYKIEKIWNLMKFMLIIGFKMDSQFERETKPPFVHDWNRNTRNSSLDFMKGIWGPVMFDLMTNTEIFKKWISKN